MTRETTAPARPADIGRIAIVDDDPALRRMMRAWLEADGYRTVDFSCGRDVLADPGERPAIVCLDLGLGDIPGLDLLAHLKARDPDLPVIVVTARREIDTAVAAMRAGAYDYLAKPLDPERLGQAVRRAVERNTAAQHLRRQRERADETAVLPGLIGQSPPMRELARQIERVLESDVSVCLFGESGSGKEVVARAVHDNGRRARGSFVAINCAAIPAALQESELFGHEKGAFTGASALHRGRFEQATNGTLFLDEIGEMSPATQASLLRALQERTIRRVGGTAEIPINARVICATHRDLASEVKAGRFREDLYFRLVVYPVRVPTLRERPDDLPLLVGHFLRKFAPDVARPIQRISPEALDALGRHQWPGNVRELQNVVHRAMLSCDGDELTLADLPPDLRKLALPALPAEAPAAMRAEKACGCHETDEIVPLQELERRAINRALKATGGSVGKAAKLLGIGRTTLYRRLAELGMPTDAA